jgi:hypothetical protein
VSDRLDAVRSAMVRVLTFGRDRDGRILAAVALACYFLLVGLPRALWGVNIWPNLGVPAAPTLFFDTRVVTAGLECRRLGWDPLTNNPCDPMARPLNYPRIWLLLRWLGLNQSHTDLLGVIFVAAFLFALALLVGRLTLGEGVVGAVALCSPAVMFGIERGNTDLVVFALLAWAIIVWRRAGAHSPTMSPLITLFAAILKIFPLFALPAYVVIRRRHAAVAALIGIGVFVLYAFVFRHDFSANFRTTPQSQYYMFGARILPSTVYHYLVAGHWAASPIVKQLIAVIPIVVALPILWLAGRRRLPDSDLAASEWRRLSFFMGALLFLGPFALGNSWDYRLVFTLLMLPQLFAWARDPAADPRGWLAAMTIVVVLLMLWLGTLGVPLRTFDELTTWATAGLAVVLLGASVPRLPDVVSDVVAGGGAQRIAEPRSGVEA